jgi:hypothetical protein
MFPIAALPFVTVAYSLGHPPLFMERIWSLITYFDSSAAHRTLDPSFGHSHLLLYFPGETICCNSFKET